MTGTRKTAKLRLLWGGKRRLVGGLGPAAAKENTYQLSTTNLKKVRSFGQGDWVCLEAVYTGTHKGPFQGPAGQTISPTGKKVETWLTLLFKVERGKVTEEHDYYVQLGLTP